MMILGDVYCWCWCWVSGGMEGCRGWQDLLFRKGIVLLGSIDGSYRWIKRYQGLACYDGMEMGIDMVVIILILGLLSG